MSSSDLTTVRPMGAGEEERFAASAEVISAQQVHAAPTTSSPSRTSILLGSIGFGAILLLAWQFVPPALGIPPSINPTATDLAHAFSRVLARENLLLHLFSTVTIP